MEYEYKFIRFGKGALWVSSYSEDAYKEIIHRHAKEGWRLVQVFAPSTSIWGLARYYDIILEKPIKHENTEGVTDAQ